MLTVPVGNIMDRGNEEFYVPKFVLPKTPTTSRRHDPEGVADLVAHLTKLAVEFTHGPNAHPAFIAHRVLHKGTPQSDSPQRRTEIARLSRRHLSLTFEDELVALAERYGVAFDPRYLWT